LTSEPESLAALVLWAIGAVKHRLLCFIERGTCTPMFIAAMSTIAKLWKEPRWIKKMDKSYSAIKNNEILPFAMMWMELESIMLSEISQSEKDKYHMVSLICGI